MHVNMIRDMITIRRCYHWRISLIRMTKQDAQYHRFLWKPPVSEKISTYQMDRRLGQRKIAAMKAINDDLYIEDYLDCAKTQKEMITRVEEVKEILSCGIFIILVTECWNRAKRQYHCMINVPNSKSYNVHQVYS